MWLVINFLLSQILPLSCFAVIFLGLVRLHSIPLQQRSQDG